MASAPRTVFGPGLTSLYDWAAADWTHAALAGGAALASAGALALLAVAVRRRRAAAAARRKAAVAAGQEPEEGLDVFTAYVTVMATLLSINGIWHVFTVAVPLPWLARLVACTVMESAGLAFMRQARRDIKRGTPATRHVVTVWTIACLSGALSAAASSSVLEGVIRVALPLLAVHLCHSWMLPLVSEVTLSQHEKGKRAWRYVKATRRRDRANNILTIYLAQKLLNLESDRLTKRSLMTGDATAVLAASERIAITEALSGLGLDFSDSDSRTLSMIDGPEGSDSRTLGPSLDGPRDADPRTLESEIDGLSDPDPAVIARTLGPGSEESEEGADRGPRDADPEPEPVLISAAAPQKPPFPAGAEPLTSGFLPQQRTNPLGSEVAVAEPWPLPEQTPGALFLPPAPAEGPQPAAQSVIDGPERSDSRTLGSEIDGLSDPDPAMIARTLGPESVIGGPSQGPESEPEAVQGPAAESEGPSLPEPSADPEFEAEELAALPWSAETSRIGRRVVAEWRAAQRPVTRAELLTEVRQRGGSVSSRDRSGFYAWAIAPELPTADNDDAFDLVGAGAGAR